MRYAAPLITFLILVQSFVANAEVMVGKMDCTIKSQTIVSTKDGKTKEYSGFEGKPKVGDTITAQYEMRLGAVAFYLKRNGVGFVHNTPTYGKKVRSFRDDTVKFENDFDGSTLTFGKNKIHSRTEKDEVVLERYYKSDWEGIYIALKPMYGLTAQIMTLDCRQTADKVDIIVDAVKADQKANQ